MAPRSYAKPHSCLSQLLTLPWRHSVPKLEADVNSPLDLVCSACRAGPFSYEAFRKAIVKLYYTPDYSVGDISEPDIYSEVQESEIRPKQQIPSTSYINYQRALQCIKECATQHEHCPPWEKTTLPTRVIDCSDPSKPRLVGTNRQMRDFYCTLSYAWGGNQTQKTTKANIDTYRKGINVPLPQTIADAITVTHKLGMQYLWVDALCIIQDSSEDKDKELCIMAYIYRDAHLSLSAVSAYRADQGFLPDQIAPDKLPFHLNDKSVGTMLLRYDIPPGNEIGSRKTDTSLKRRSLQKRGWCYQENVLSPRKLMFQPPNVFFKCRSYSEIEVSVHRGSARGSFPEKDNLILFPSNRGHAQMQANAPKVDPDTLRRLWWSMIEQYSGCALTVPSDKLVACASIAEIFQPIMKDQYVAGLWRRSLIQDLLWEIDPPTEAHPTLLPRPAVYRAPTWSWASVNMRLNIFFTFPAMIPPASATSYEAEIIACDITLKNDALPFGEITDARLTLRAKMHPLMMNPDEAEGKFTLDEGNHWWWIPPPGHCLESGSSSANGQSGQGHTTLDCLEVTVPDDKRTIHVIILRGDRKSQGMGDWVQGLLVVPVEGKEEEYQRVGKVDRRRFEWPDWIESTPLKTITLMKILLDVPGVDLCFATTLCGELYEYDTKAVHFFDSLRDKYNLSGAT
ncbi:HET-domain-containing protein [Pholiota conissans]|uniref:HET-domain-containing protein n=1 Tax=Pholiota conissans TaxID=109636 RepID=A0A9P5Z7S3_9AGAR|nr:HET-domain-containing protein [Pholiota conissans]